VDALRLSTLQKVNLHRTSGETQKHVANMSLHNDLYGDSSISTLFYATVGLITATPRPYSGCLLHNIYCDSTGKAGHKTNPVTPMIFLKVQAVIRAKCSI